ncbi:hypothetical protein M9H77_31086 [Catharanthus roseus]|uniref:Uncharacterized protein n=1 Tax=Catharanthus roseus TaxID=4058 RepID=A0ACB9ZZY1_CATRO|nr:hypothetical protein M9H77_31086 [Catharanthus roseus]
MPFPFRPDSDPSVKEDGTLELYYLSAYCLPKILLLQLVGHRVIQISCVFCGFPMLQLMYQFDRSRIDRLNILLGRLVANLQCVVGIACKIHHFTYFISSTLSHTSIETEWFHVLSSIVYKIEWQILRLTPSSRLFSKNVEPGM